MTLRQLVLEAYYALDPDRQGLGWPDPIAWDGRPLREQARDLVVDLDGRARAASRAGDRVAAFKFERLADSLWGAIHETEVH